MAYIRLSNSGKALMFYDERGFVYMISSKYVQWALNSSSKEPMILTLLPGRVPADILPPSKVFIDGENMTLEEAFEKGLIDSSFWKSIADDESSYFGYDGASVNKKSRRETPVGDVNI